MLRMGKIILVFYEIILIYFKSEISFCQDVPAGPAGPVVPGARVRRQMSSISQGAKLDNYK